MAKLCGVHVELKAKFALQHYFDNFNDLYLKLIELLKDKDLKNKWNKRKIRTAKAQRAASRNATIFHLPDFFAFFRNIVMKFFIKKVMNNFYKYDATSK